MVMEPPTPQCVGREFVRQYYTLLNQAPLHLHRFYNSHSSFVHGGIDGGTEAEEVRGQQEIHEKIVQLNFKDCHAKIRKVDSHKTLGDGVVVQVSGELSNNGQPMRRFVQTFVLAPQSPKKYYVHNDIFRYQDEVFTDGESESASTMSAEEHGRLEKPIQEQILAAAQVTKAAAQQAAQIQQQAPPQEPVKPEPVQEEPSYNQEPHVNGVGYASPPEEPAMEVEEEPTPVWKEADVEPDVMEDDEALLEQEVAQVPAPPVQQHHHQHHQQQQQPQEPAPSSGPMSYRDRVLASKPPAGPAAAAATNNTQQTSSSAPVNAVNNATGSGAAKDQTVTYQPQQQQQQQPPQQPPHHQQQQAQQMGGMNAQQANNTSAAVAGGPPSSGKSFRARESSRGRTSTGGGGTAGGGGGGVGPPSRGDRYGGMRNEDGNMGDMVGRPRMTSSAGDQYQLFVGNLPHSCNEADLKELFSKFGQVLEVRINKKTSRPQGQKHGSNFTVPNYGFVVFETVNSVEMAMKSQPILLNGSHRLNIEEKKSREVKNRENMGGKDSMDRRDMDRRDMDRRDMGMQGGFDRSQGGRSERGSQDNLRGAGHMGGGGRGGDRGRGMGGRGGRGRGDFGGRGRGGPSDSRGGFRGGGGPRN